MIASIVVFYKLGVYKVKLQIKFLLLGAISIFCVLSLSYNSYTDFNRYVYFVDKIKKTEALTQIYSEKNIANNSIRSDLWHAIYSHDRGQKQDVENIRQKLNDYLEKDDKELDKEVASILPKDINQHISNIHAGFKIYVNDARAVLNALGGNNIDSKLAKFEASFKEINAESNLLNTRMSNFISITSKEGDVLLNDSFKESIIITSFSIILVCLVSLFSNFNLFSPLTEIVKVMNLIVNNDLSKEVPFISRTDEVGDIAKALEVFRSTVLEKEKLEEQAKQQVKKSEDDRRNSMLSFSNQFETSIKGIVDMVDLAVKKMDTTALQLEQLAIHTQEETTLLSSTSVQANTNMQGVSKATNEFSSSVNEISIQVTNSLEYARRVAEQADKVNTVVVDLEAKASAISSIIDIINGITSQIDLLALNATIEAARAGDMGKGFAVVANEVKALATQTSKATEQINFQISGIQTSTNKAVMAVQEITTSVRTINQNSASIVSAVEKQNTTSSYIADGISQVANMSGSVVLGVEKVADSSNHSGKAASQMVSAAGDLLKQSGMLQSEVDKFLSSLKF